MMSQSSQWTDEAFARLEVIVREQEAARAWLDHIERSWSAQREQTMATIAALSAEYDELYAALDTYAHVESQPCSEIAPPPPWGVTPSLPTAFDGPPMQWDPIVAPASIEPRARSTMGTVAIVLAITLLALGLGVLLAAIVTGRTRLEPVAALPTTALERVTTVPTPTPTPTPTPEPVVVAAIVTPEPEPEAAAPPIADTAPTQLGVAAKAPVAKRAKKPTRAKKHRKKSRSARRKHTSPARRIGVTSSSDPLAGV
jgi:hypothetical protein